MQKSGVRTDDPEYIKAHNILLAVQKQQAFAKQRFQQQQQLQQQRQQQQQQIQQSNGNGNEQLQQQQAANGVNSEYRVTGACFYYIFLL
jgi:ATP-dependent helicase STH1/SNF2